MEINHYIINIALNPARLKQASDLNGCHENGVIKWF
jgi:hypothetical protein